MHYPQIGKGQKGDRIREKRIEKQGAMVKEARLPDARLYERLVEALSKASRKHAGAWRKRKRLTVFWGNERVTHAAIIQTQCAETLTRMAGERLVLLIEDTTSLDFSSHADTVELGPLGNGQGRGCFAHSTLAASAVGVPLGLLVQQVWGRSEETTGKRATWHERPFAEKKVTNG
jgi:hypothetical protein